MKQAFKTAIAATALILFGLTTFAQQYDNAVPAPMNQQQQSGANTLVLQNNTAREIYVSFVFFDKVQNCWVSRGWRSIPAYGNNTIFLDDLNLGSNIMYLHAENRFKNWGSNFTFCANNGSGAFKILYADQVNCNIKKQYDQTTVNNGQNLYTFNP